MKFHTPSFFIGAMFGSKKRQRTAIVLVLAYMLGAMVYLMYVFAYGLFYALPVFLYNWFKTRREVIADYKIKASSDK
jgi:riboflavin transporter FmnP